MAKFLSLFCTCLLLVWGLSSAQAHENLPSLALHPLPPSLEQWFTPAAEEDYFSALEPTPVGALLWTRFPISVYWEQPPARDGTAEGRRWLLWSDAVAEAVQAWHPYLPLQIVENSSHADIVIRRSPPPLGSYFDSLTGQLVIPRARAAQTRYELYSTSDQPPRLAHRMTIFISPGLGESLLLAASLHELGHALGIWGHSPEPTDALFFAQVPHSAAISARDVNTLKKVYQQPTRLGWPLQGASN